MTNPDLKLGNCLEIMETMPGGSVSAVITDLPYGITNSPYDSMLDIQRFWRCVAQLFNGSHGVVVTTASQPFTSLLVTSNLPWFRHEWIWQKNRGSNFANTVREPMKEHESVLVFSPGRWVYNPQMQERAASGRARVAYPVKQHTKSENYRNFDDRGPVLRGELRVPSSVQRFNTEVGLHPQQKPVSLFEYLVHTYTNEGDTVLDPTMGSGTCGVACLRLKRKFIGIEISPGRFEIAQKRLSEVQVSLI